MKIEDIKNPELKQLILMSYMHEENNNPEMVEKTKSQIKENIKENEFIISTENDEFVKIPYANDGKYIIPIFTDFAEYKRGMEYYELNDMIENKDFVLGKIEKIDNPNFLGYLINIASTSYITQI